MAGGRSVANLARYSSMVGSRPSLLHIQVAGGANLSSGVLLRVVCDGVQGGRPVVTEVAEGIGDHVIPAGEKNGSEEDEYPEETSDLLRHATPPLPGVLEDRGLLLGVSRLKDRNPGLGIRKFGACGHLWHSRGSGRFIAPDGGLKGFAPRRRFLIFSSNHFWWMPVFSGKEDQADDASFAEFRRVLRRVGSRHQPPHGPGQDQGGDP
jgi:hypothetical protein